MSALNTTIPSDADAPAAHAAIGWRAEPVSPEPSRTLSALGRFSPIDGPLTARSWRSATRHQLLHHAKPRAFMLLNAEAGGRHVVERVTHELPAGKSGDQWVQQPL